MFNLTSRWQGHLTGGGAETLVEQQAWRCLPANSSVSSVTQAPCPHVNTYRDENMNKDWKQTWGLNGHTCCQYIYIYIYPCKVKQMYQPRKRRRYNSVAILHWHRGVTSRELLIRWIHYGGGSSVTVFLIHCTTLITFEYYYILCLFFVNAVEEVNW